MVSAPVEVIAALTVMLPEYQLPAADTAADDEVQDANIWAIGSVLKCNGATTDVRVTSEVPRGGRVMLSLDVVIDKASLGVMAPKVV